MPHRYLSIFAVAVLGLLAPASAQPSSPDSPSADPSPGQSWPQWRGPLGTGEAVGADPPVRWSETENVRFTVDLPGLGHSTPAVWGNHVFLTLAAEDRQTVSPRRSGAPGAHDNLAVSSWFRFGVMAIDRRDGRVLFGRDVHRALPHEGGHVSASLASASPVTDGERVYASFGSHGLYALDFEGELVWKRDLGRLRTKHAHGEGSSPVLDGETLVVNADHEGDSFLVALHTADGRVLWKTPREEPTSWASPIVVEVGTGKQVIVSGTERVRAYDLATGREIWQCGGLSANVVATPVAGDGRVYVASSYDIRAMMAISLAGAKGDITGTEHVLWSRTERTPYVPSPLLYEGDVYFLRHYQGVLSRVDGATGAEPAGPVRLPGIRNIYASPVAAGGRIYITDRQGSTIVLRPVDAPARPFEDSLEVLAINRLDDRFSASPVAVGDALFLRGENKLYCLARPKPGPSTLEPGPS